MANRSRTAFGSEANIDSALSSGKIDAYDILFLDEKKIGWIDKNGQKVILENDKQVKVVSAIPETGVEDVLYIVVDGTNSESISVSGYIWNGEKFVQTFSSNSNGTVNEETVDSKIEAALSIVEF